MVESNLYRIALIGASGAIGKEIMEYLQQDGRFSEIIVLVRRTLPEWV
jgi:aspartate-semialdehyde dehydrogenase